MAEPKRAGIFRYIKEAFLFRWNLLILGGASIAALLTVGDAGLPLIGAAEVIYLAGLSTLPRFQAAIDAKARAETDPRAAAAARPAPQNAAATRDRIVDVLKSLAEDRRARFLRLRARCVEMTRIAN